MTLSEILESVRSGALDPASAAAQIKSSGYEDLGFAKLDFQREARRKFGEVVYCPGKTSEQLLAIFRAFAEKGRPALGTRATQAQADFVVAGGIPASYDAVSRLLKFGNLEIWKLRNELRNCEIAELRNDESTGKEQSNSAIPQFRNSAIPKISQFPNFPISQFPFIAVCTGGTADLPVAEEAAQTAEFFGAEVRRFYDVGVAGLHRLLSKIDEIRKAGACIAVAGMEGALGSVLAGLVERPVIGVPTSVGYGASFHGVAPLLTMLNSCAEGMSVVNIDNGYGAGYLASQIVRGVWHCPNSATESSGS